MQPKVALKLSPTSETAKKTVCMITYPPPQFDQQKSEVLQRYDILSAAENFDSDQAACTLSLVLGVPIVIAAVNERYRGWFRCATGIENHRLSGLQNYCAHAHLSRHAFAVEDVRRDGYLADEAKASGFEDLVFFAGAPLNDPHGKRLGTLCLMDTKPRLLSKLELQILESFARLVSQDICLRSAGRYAVNDLIHAEEDRCTLYDMAMSDPLTKALNRRAFFRFTEREFRRAVRHGTSMAVLTIDIDHFKQVNDIHGHAVGDQVLAQLVEVLSSGTRDEDIIGRIGGEEFAMVFPETTVEKAVRLAERLREDVKALVFESAVGSFSISISVGVSEPLRNERDISFALKRSDTALYEAKRSGRDQVKVC